MPPMIVVEAEKELGRDNIRPRWDTLTVMPGQFDMIGERPVGVGDILATWDVDWGTADPEQYARTTFPGCVWVFVPGGHVAVDLRHVTFDGR